MTTPLYFKNENEDEEILFPETGVCYHHSRDSFRASAWTVDSKNLATVELAFFRYLKSKALRIDADGRPLA